MTRILYAAAIALLLSLPGTMHAMELGFSTSSALPAPASEASILSTGFTPAQEQALLWTQDQRDAVTRTIQELQAEQENLAAHDLNDAEKQIALLPFRLAISIHQWTLHQDNQIRKELDEMRQRAQETAQLMQRMKEEHESMQQFRDTIARQEQQPASCWKLLFDVLKFLIRY